MADLKIVLTVVDRATGQVKTVRKSLKELEGGVAATDTKLSSLQKTLGGLSVGKLAGFGVAGVTVGLAADKLFEATAAASDLNETVNKTGVVFGNSAAAVMKLGDNSVRALGMSKNEALAAAANYGNLFSSMKLAEDESARMSSRLVQLAADMASFSNTSPTQALEALQSALVGESEPIRKYGVLLNETAVEAKAAALGFKSVGGELSEAAKVQARYSLILDQTVKAQGDFARTADGYANSQRSLDASMKNISATAGKLFVPVMARGAKALSEVATEAEKAIDRLDKMPMDKMVQLPGGGNLHQLTDDWAEFTKALSDFGAGRDRLLSSAKGAEYNLFAADDVRGKEDALRDLIKAYQDWVGVSDETAQRIQKAQIDAANATSRAWRQTERDFADSMSNMARIGEETAAQNATAAANIRSRMWREMERADDAAMAVARGKMQAVWDSVKWGSQELLDIDTRNFNEGTDKMLEELARKNRETARNLESTWNEHLSNMRSAASEAVSGIRAALEGLTRTPLLGSGAATAGITSLKEQIDASEATILEMQASKGPRAGIRAEQRRQEALRRQLALAEARYRRDFSPLERQIGEAANPALPERSFGEIMSGILSGRAQLAAAEAVQSTTVTNHISVQVDAGGRVSVSGATDEGRQIAQQIAQMYADFTRELFSGPLSVAAGAPAAVPGAGY